MSKEKIVIHGPLRNYWRKVLKRIAAEETCAIEGLSIILKILLHLGSVVYMYIIKVN